MSITRWLGSDRYSSKSTTDPTSLDYFNASDLAGSNETNVPYIHSTLSAVPPLQYNNNGRFSLADPTVLNDLEVQGEFTHTGSTYGTYGVTAVAQPTDIGTVSSLTDSTGGTSNATVVAVSGTGDDTNVNDNFADVIAAVNDLVSKVNGLRTQQQALGHMA